MKLHCYACKQDQAPNGSKLRFVWVPRNHSSWSASERRVFCVDDATRDPEYMLIVEPGANK